jgi:type I restriction enzyme S subunit
MQIQNNTPTLRFPEFSGEWEKKKLGEVGETYGGLSGKSKENFGTGKPYIQYKQIFDDGKIDISRFELVEIGENENQNKVRFGDVFFTVSSETPNEIGMSSVLLDEIDELYLNSFCFGFRANSLQELSPYFSQYLFRSELFRTEIIKLAQGSTRYNMSKIQLLKIEISIPTLPEQTKIANFLTAVDEKIQALKKKKSLLEAYKKGLMQQLFAQELRFKDENGAAFPDWEVKKLGEISKITTGASNRQDSSLVGEFTFFDRSQDIRTSDKYLFDGEAIIVPGEGQEFIPKYFIGKFDLHQRTYAIMDFKNANGLFLYYSISFNTNHLNSQAVGSTVKSLRLPMFETMPINLPSLPEQTKIAHFLSAIDAKIAQVQLQIANMETWKKGLLQKMFV